MSDYAALGPRAGLRDTARAGKARGGDRVLFLLVSALALVALAAAAILVLPSALRVTRYEVSGNASLSRDEVLSAALIHDREYFFSLDASRVKAALEAQPRIAAAEARKVFPSGLKIALRERSAVAVALASVGGRETAVCLDGEGVAFAEASAEEAAAAPVLSGIRFESFRPGTRLPPAVAGILAALGRVRSTDPALLAAVSEIRIVAPAAAGGEPELLIYPLHHRIPVRAGASLDAPTLRSIILVLDVLGTRGIADSVREIDFRGGRVVYSSKEGQPG